jgi:hypothetical protein
MLPSPYQVGGNTNTRFIAIYPELVEWIDFGFVEV